MVWGHFIIMNGINRETRNERSNPNSELFDPLAVIKEKL